MIAKRIQVQGKVQGVFFRASTKSTAEDLDLKGWVRNEPDGSVLIEVQGEASQMNKFTEWCESGPTYASVTDIKIEDISIQSFTGFQILH
ncbi:acylphosphatase [Ekhidna sp.]|uniref:acylphosphatase n=1 Tax=Ekhidna sp. TaxID=2608089 RepID=UPI00329A3476